MSLVSKIALAVGGFVLATGVVYGLVAADYEGMTLMITVAGGIALVGVYLVSAVKRARAALAGRAKGAPAEAHEPHVAPTIWPLVLSLSAIGLVVGAVASRWALVAGGALLAVASVGWILDVRDQWGHQEGGG